jgi:hypothetical protein
MYVLHNLAKQLWEHVTAMHMPNCMYNCLTRIVQAWAEMKCSHVTKIKDPISPTHSRRSETTHTQ